MKKPQLEPLTPKELEESLSNLEKHATLQEEKWAEAVKTELRRQHGNSDSSPIDEPRSSEGGPVLLAGIPADAPGKSENPSWMWPRIACALIALIFVPGLMSSQTPPRIELVAPPVAIGEHTEIRLRVITPNSPGAKVAILDGFRIAGYATAGQDGIAEYTINGLEPGQHWLRASIAGKQGERSTPVPIAIPAPTGRSEFSPKQSRLESSFAAETKGNSATSEAQLGTSATLIRTILIDLNQDNTDDRVELQSGSFSVSLGDGRGGYYASRRVPAITTQADFVGGVSASDWNEDGLPDIAIGSSTGVLICFGDGDGGFRSTQWIPDVQLPAGEMAGDLNGDGHADLVVLQNTEQGRVLAGLFGDGVGTMAVGPITSNPDPDMRIDKLEIADRDGDGVIDFIQAGEVSPLRWSRSTDGQFHLDATKQRNSILSAVEPRSASEGAASTWGTTYYGQILPLTSLGGSSMAPRSILVDNARNIFFTQYEYSLVRKISKETGIITTIAGGGTIYPGDGGLAINASLNGSSSISMDSANALYIAESYGNRVRKVDLSSGLISTVAGTGEAGFSGDGQVATSAKLNSPAGIAIDGFGNLYIAESENNRIRRVSAADGVIQTIAGNGMRGSTGDGTAAINAPLNEPSSVQVDGAGNVFIVETYPPRIRRVDAKSGLISTISGAGQLEPTNGLMATSAKLKAIGELAVDRTGNLYFMSGSCQLLKLDTAGSLSVLWSISGSWSSYSGGVAADGEGNILSQIPGPIGPLYGDHVVVIDLTSPKFAISTTQAFLGAGAGNGSFTITSDPVGGQWAAISDMPWVQVTPANGTGAATLSYSYAASDSSNIRTAKIVVNGQTLTLQQSGAAPTYSLNPSSAALSGQAGNGTASLTVSPADAYWAATGIPTWLTVSPSSGNGSATITYRASSNFSVDPRTAVISVNANAYQPSPKATLTLTQAPAATVSLSPASGSVGTEAGSLTAQLSTTPAGATWSANSDSPWLNVTPSAGVGDTLITIAFTRNGSAKSRTSAISIGTQKLTITQAGAPLETSFSLNRSSLNFGATRGGAATPPEVVSITQTSGISAAPWTVATDQPWCKVSPLTGSGSGQITVSVDNKNLPSSSASTCRVTIAAPGASPSSYTVSAYLSISGTASASPFGSFDTPADGATGVVGSIAVTGWALDDVGVKSVTIWRDRVGPEPVQSNGYVYIGDAMFVRGARPDIEAKYPTSPNAKRAGWGYMMLTYGLPGQGNGTYKIHAIATDEEGHQVKLGTKTISVDNAHAIKPFGALDSPAPGQTVSGTFSNSGWVLTPRPAAIPTDGSTIYVSIDGVNVGHPIFGAARGDINSLFPGYANSNTSAGQFFLDSTKYSNGMHSIAWNVYDSLGRGDGIGSRYFYIENAVTATSASPSLPEDRTVQLRAARQRHPAIPETNYPAFRHGYDWDAALTPIRQAGGGLMEPIDLNELDRLEIHLSTDKHWTAALRVGDELRELPVGSTFDAEGCVFYWQLGPGFLGDYVLEFSAEDGTVVPVTVHVGGTIRAGQ